MGSGLFGKFVRGNLYSMVSISRNSNLMYSSLAQEKRQKSVQGYEIDNYGSPRKCNYKKSYGKFASKFRNEPSKSKSLNQIHKPGQKYLNKNILNHFELPKSGLSTFLLEKVRNANEKKNTNLQENKTIGKHQPVYSKNRGRSIERKDRLDNLTLKKTGNDKSTDDDFEKVLATDILKYQSIDCLNSKKSSTRLLNEKYIPFEDRGFHQFRSPSCSKLDPSIGKYLMPVDDDVKRIIAIPQFVKSKRVFIPKYNWNKPPPKSALELKLSLDREFEMGSRRNIRKSPHKKLDKIGKIARSTGLSDPERPKRSSSSNKLLSKTGSLLSPRISPTKTLAKHINFNLLPQNDGPLASRYHHISYLRSKMNNL